jgi:structural maintenance of chromosome 2
VLSAFSQELEELDRAIKAKTQEISDSELRAQESSHDIEKLTREKKAADLEARHSWIVEEKE